MATTLTIKASPKPPLSFDSPFTHIHLLHLTMLPPLISVPYQPPPISALHTWSSLIWLHDQPSSCSSQMVSFRAGWLVHPEDRVPPIPHKHTPSSTHNSLPPMIYGYSTAATSPTSLCSTSPSGLNSFKHEMTLYDMGSVNLTCKDCSHRPSPRLTSVPLSLLPFSFSFSMGSCAFGTSWSVHFVHDWVRVWA